MPEHVLQLSLRAGHQGLIRRHGRSRSRHGYKRQFEVLDAVTDYAAIASGTGAVEAAS